MSQKEQAYAEKVAEGKATSAHEADISSKPALSVHQSRLDMSRWGFQPLDMTEYLGSFGKGPITLPAW